jgi:hypothetical protein
VTATRCCAGKRRHRTWISAVAAAIRLSRQNIPLRVYRCPRGGWHLTSQTNDQYEARRREVS